jgi:hypothetical protein
VVALTPDDIQALTGSSGDSTPLSVPDCRSVVSSALRRDSTKEVMGISLGQTAVIQSFPANVKRRAEAEGDRTKSDKTIIVAQNDGTSVEDENIKSAIEVESDKSVGVKNRTVAAAGNDNSCGQANSNELPVVSMTAGSCAAVSEHLNVSVKTSFLTSLLSSANVSRDCGVVPGNVVGTSEHKTVVSENVVGTSEQQTVVCGNVVSTSEQQTVVSGNVLSTSEQQTVILDPDVSVGASWLELQNRKTDAMIPVDTVPGPSVSDVSPAHMLPTDAICRVSASQGVHAETVEGNAEACTGSVRVKQEQSSEHDENDLSVYDVTMGERLQESEELKVEPEVML